MRLLLACLLSMLAPASLYAEQITIGTSAYDPPFEMAADTKGNFFGFEIDIMNQICKRIQVTCQYKPFTFVNLLRATQAGEVDLAISGISITKQRQAFYLFSVPYLASKAQLLSQSTAAFNGRNNNDRLRIGVEAGTLFKRLAETKFSRYKLIEYKTQNEMLEAIVNDDIDLIILDAVSAKYWVVNNEGLFKLVGDAMPLGIGYGIMANASKAALIDRVNQAIVSMQNDGTYLAIYKQYF